jgi:quercetin dioxygenase-like cupin family protein
MTQGGIAVWNFIKQTISMLLACALSVFAVSAAMAQDPTKVDANHYKVTFENDQVRIVRITYGPKEKSVMHEHPNSVAVFLTDGQIKFNLPGGKSLDISVKAGQSQ